MKIFFTLILLALPVSAVETAEAAYFLCRLHNEVRTIRVEPASDQSRCQAIYTKNGADQKVGASQSPETCADIVRRIKTNLEKGGWRCRDRSESVVIDQPVGDESTPSPTPTAVP